MNMPVHAQHMHASAHPSLPHCGTWQGLGVNMGPGLDRRRSIDSLHLSRMLVERKIGWRLKGGGGEGDGGEGRRKEETATPWKIHGRLSCFILLHCWSRVTFACCHIWDSGCMSRWGCHRAEKGSEQLKKNRRECGVQRGANGGIEVKIIWARARNRAVCFCCRGCGLVSVSVDDAFRPLTVDPV